MKVLVFGSSSEARTLANAVEGQYVSRLSARLDDLRLVAQYGVVEPVCIVVLRGTKTHARIPRLVEPSELLALLAHLR